MSCTLTFIRPALPRDWVYRQAVMGPDVPRRTPSSPWWRRVVHRLQDYMNLERSFSTVCRKSRTESRDTHTNPPLFTVVIHHISGSKR